MAKPRKLGEEFRINTTTKEWQTDASITGLSNGRFLVTWEDNSETGGDKSSLSIRAQLFNADGSKRGGEFLVNTATKSIQYEPFASPLDEGRFVVMWTDNSQTGGDTSAQGVRGQIFNSDGSKSGGEFLVNTGILGTQDSPEVALLSNGGFAAVWNDLSGTSGDPSSFAVSAQIFNAGGTPFGGEFLVNASTAGAQIGPSIAAIDGRFVVAWQDEPAGADTPGEIRAQLFDNDGNTFGNEFLVNTTTVGDQFSPVTAGLDDGGFVIAWTDRSRTGQDSSGSALRAQVFEADGDPVGGEFLVNSTAKGKQEDPAVAALPDGCFVIAWADGSRKAADKSGSAIRAQVFDSDGSKMGKEFLVNTETSRDQFLPTVTALVDGRFVIAWSDFSAKAGDKSKAAVKGQIFDARDAPVFIDGTAVADDLVGTRFKDSFDGGGGSDILDGGDGRDTLTGGPGADRFVFSTALKKTEADVITDFSPAADRFVLDMAVFGKLPKGELKGKFFHVGPKARDGDDRIVYNDENGSLTFDANGKHKGGEVKLALLAEGLDLSAANFIVG